jgi:drug/metabolite transporter (DMT)-like permease
MGIIAVLLSCVFVTSKDVLSKKLAVRIDGTASTFASFAFALPFYLLVLAVMWALDYDIFHFTATFWSLVVLRAVTDVFAEWMKMYAFAHGDISLVSIVFSFSPLIVLLLSPMTGDTLSAGGIAAVVVVVVGSVAVVYRPSHPEWGKQRKAMLLAAGATVFFGMNSIYDRIAMEQRSDPATAVVGGFTMTAVSAAMLLPFVLFRPDRLTDMSLYRRGLLARGILEVAFMVCKLVGMQFLAAAYVVGLQRLSLLLSIIAGRVVFKEGDFRRRLLAGILILGGALWILWEQTKAFNQ